MSGITSTPTRNDVRYEIDLRYFKDGKNVVYEMLIKDMGFTRQDSIIFRFSEAASFHEGMLKYLKDQKERLP